mgnify:CR=1 FL=1
MIVLYIRVFIMVLWTIVEFYKYIEISKLNKRIEEEQNKIDKLINIISNKP